MLIDQIVQAVTLFGLGMGTVFILLSLLISCVSLLSLFCKNVGALQTEVPMVSAPVIPPQASQQTISDLEISIVKAAVTAHRQAQA